ncbi:MAG: SusD/RagB family nutrient-binding outer membrane lipoprotein [Ferruginibacter sp.]
MKHTINKRFIFILMSAGIIFGSSCKKTYLDVNSDPNRVTDANVTAELIFPAAAAEVGSRAASGNFTFLNEWLGYWAPNGGFVPQQNVITYNIDFTFGDVLFQNHYNALFDLHQAEVKGLATGDSAVAGASIILSAKLFQELVDLYGDVPYSQTFQVVKYTTPVYDKAQDIYNSLQKRLDTAIMYMKLPQVKAFAPADIINNGNAGRWIAFANTLKLRLLIRQSEASGFNWSAEIAKIQATGGVLTAGQSISVNPGYVNDVDKQNPYYDNYGWTPTGTQSNLSTDANEYIVNVLSTTHDPRLDRLFFPGGFDPANGYVGNVFGDPIGTLAQASASSYFGPALVGELNGSNVGNGYSRNQFIYPSYESLFLYAEAVARKWISGDANAALAAAIKESFVWLGVPNAATAATTYIAANPKIAKVSSDSSVATNVKIIAYQKYIANTGIDPLESYFDLNRLHFLTDKSYISTAPGLVSHSLPLRLLYPQSEYTTNAGNTPKQVAGDAFTQKLFWEP